MFERILVAVDGGETSTRALVVATQMASDSAGRARLRLLHVLDAPLALGGAATFTQNLSELQNTFVVGRDIGNQVLFAAEQLTQAAGVEADTQLLDRFGESLGSMVAGAALRWHADLVVVGTHGRHGVGRVLLGSGAEDIVRSATVPVLVVRLPTPSSANNSIA